MGLFAVVREPGHGAYSLVGEIENEQVTEMQRMEEKWGWEKKEQGQEAPLSGVSICDGKDEKGLAR